MHTAIEQPKVNNQIKATDVRVIGSDGANLGVMTLEIAITRAKSENKDLIEVAGKASPPVCRIMDVGKFKYQKEKEARAARKKVKEVDVRGVRARINISAHDLERKIRDAEEFLEGGDNIRFDLILRGREKALPKSFVNERLQQMLNMITVPYKIMEGPKSGPRGLMLTLAPEKHGKNKQSSSKENQSDSQREGTSPIAKPESL